MNYTKKIIFSLIILLLSTVNIVYSNILENPNLPNYALKVKQSTDDNNMWYNNNIFNTPPDLTLWVKDNHQAGAGHNHGTEYQCGQEYYIPYTGQTGGTTQDVVYELKNMGDQDLVINVLQLSGDTTANFELVNLPATPITLGNMASVDVTVRYTFPAVYTPNTYYGRLQIVSNDPTSALCEALIDVGCGTYGCPTALTGLEQANGDVLVTGSFVDDNGNPIRSFEAADEIDYTLDNGVTSSPFTATSVTTTNNNNDYQFTIPASQISAAGGINGLTFTFTGQRQAGGCGYDLTCNAPINVTVNPTVEICNNGIDDDGDGLIDYEDDDCETGVGNTVFNDANNNRTFDAGEGIDGVTMHLFNLGDDPLTDTPILITTTANDGKYFFGQVPEGDYFIHFPASQFGAGNSIGSLISLPSSVLSSGFNFAGDDNSTSNGADNGIDQSLAQLQATGMSSGFFNLARGTEPTTTAAVKELGNDFDSDIFGDENVDLTIDFVFKTPGQENCTNGFDDDGDGLVDSEDPDCQLFNCGQSLEVSQDIGRAVTNSDYENFESCVFDISPDGQFSAGFVDFRAAIFNTYNRTYTQIYDPLGGTGLTARSTAFGVSATGEAVGDGKIGPGSVDRAFYWAPGMATMVELATNDAGVTTSFATEISDNGVIVGRYNTAAGSFGIIWKTSDLANPIIIPAVKEFTTVSGTGTLIAGTDQSDNVVIYNFNTVASSATLRTTSNLTTTTNSTAKHISTDGRYLIGELDNGTGYRYDITNDVLKVIESAFPNFFGSNNRGFYEHVSPDGSITGTQRQGTSSNASYTTAFWDATKEQWIYLYGLAEGVNQDVSDQSWNMFGGGQHSDDPTMRVYSGFGNNPEGWEDSFFIMPCKVGVGNTVFADANNNGVFDAGEGIDEVTVQLFNAGDDPQTATPISETITHDDGLYFFGQLADGDYFVHIPSTQFGTGNSIGDLVSINGDSSITDDNAGEDGINGAYKSELLANGISSAAFNLALGTEPVDAGTETGNVNDYDYFGDADVDLTIDFGFNTAIIGAIGDTVWYDANGDGIQSGATELGLEGATVTLDPGTSGDTSDDVTTTTDANGNYLFDNLPAGDYTVTVDVSTVTGGLPSGVTPAELAQTFDADGTGTANSSGVTLVAGQENLNQNFGYQGVGSIGDTVWYDANGNGTQDVGENGLPGVTVTLDPGTPGNAADDITQITAPDGTYLFDNLPAGDYTITVDVSTVTAGIPSGVTPADLVQTYDADGIGTSNTSNLTLAEGENNLDQDFGYQGNVLGSIGDRVWYDEIVNATQDLGEAGLEGATVTLDPGTPGDASDDVTTTTDANGNYLFDNLPAGDYTITVDVSTVTGGLPADVTPADLSPTYDFDSVGSPNASNYTLAAGVNNVDQDFGYQGIILRSIGDTVWFDTDGDGILDAGENGLEGATVTLDPSTPGNPADDIITTTDANGNYLFDNLPTGVYTITVDVSTVTGGLPVGVTIADLIPIFDADGVGTANTSTISLPSGIDNLDQDFAYGIASGNTGGGNNGGIESESLGDALTKLYVGRKKNSVPTNFVKDASNLYNKAKMKSVQPYQGKGQTMLDMFPTQLFAGNVANVTSPTDILDITIADEVLSVDFSLNGETKGVVLGIKTTDKVYNHTKASCDRLRGAEILNIQKVNIKGYNFLMQGIKQRSGVVEYAISFATAKNNNDANYTIQTNWYVNNYTKFNDVYNFQVWTTKPADTQKLVADVLENLQSFIPVTQTEIQKVPETYASKIYRDKGELVVKLRSTEEGNTAEVSMVELYSETANNIKFRNNTLSTEIQQSLRLDIADGYEYDGLVKVDNEVEDAFYHADGNWGLDFDKRYTEIKNYFVWNNFDRAYKDDEYAINRDVEVKATSDYDYLTVYKSLLPGTISADYSEYNYVAFTAKGSGLMELGLIKSSIEDWKAQYRVMVDFSEEEQTYYVPFEIFTSSASQNTMTAEDLTTLTFTFLPVEANTTELDLKISDVRFTKTAVEDQIVNKIEKFENEFMAYPNPSKGNVNLLLFSETATEATVTLSDITGKIIYRGTANLNAGKNELDFNFKVKTGMMLLQVTSPEVDYGTTKILFR